MFPFTEDVLIRVFSNHQNHSYTIKNKNILPWNAYNPFFQISNYVKSSSDENGPGLKIEAKLGDFIVFLTPKQVYLLAEFMQEYCKTDDDR